MIIFNDISYSIPELQNASTIYIVQNFADEWQANFWQFIKDWFDDSKDFIAVKTSGSTGKPKIILHQKKNMIASAKMTNAFFNLNNTKTALLCLPTHSIGGMMMIVRALVSEMCLIVQKPSSNPLVYIDQKIDFVAMVPMQAQQIFAHDESLWRFVHTLIIGGGEVTENLRKQIKAIKLNAYSTFGMTETISHIALNKICEGNTFKALKGVQLSLGKQKNLIISAPDLSVLNLETNDVVRFEAENEFTWLGRLDNAIETGGFKLQPEMIEQKLNPFFKQNFIISSLKDKKFNNKIILILEGEKLSENYLNTAFESLPKYEKPREVFFVKALEYVPNGKIDRKRTQAVIEARFNKFNQ